MDRVTKLRGQAGGSKDSTLELDDSSLPSEAYTTAIESSKYFSLTEDDSTFDISPMKDVSLASASVTEPEKTTTENDELISNLSPIPNKNEMLDYKIGKQIEAANILSGGVDIFDDNNSYDGNELVIDDNVDTDDKANPELKLDDNDGLGFQKTEDISEATLVDNDAVASKDTEVVLQIDGKNVNAIDIGNGLYLYRKEGQEELAAVQIIDDDQNHPNFKFLKVRENAEGNLEVYEEIEVPKEVPTNEGKAAAKKTSHVPVKDVDKAMSDPPSNKLDAKSSPREAKTSANTIPSNEQHNDASKDNKKTKVDSLNGEMLKLNEKRKSPVIHSTPNKEGIPLTKTMVDLHLHPNRQLDNVKTIEVHTDIKHKPTESPTKSKDTEDDKIPLINKTDVNIEPLHSVEDKVKESQETDKEIIEVKLAVSAAKKTEETLPVTNINVVKQSLDTEDSKIPENKVNNVEIISIKNTISNDNKGGAEAIDKLLVEDKKLINPDKIGINTDEIFKQKEIREKEDKNKNIEPKTNNNSVILLDNKSLKNKEECVIPKLSISEEKLKTEARITEFFDKINKQKYENVTDNNKISVQDQSLPPLPDQTLNNKQSNDNKILENKLPKHETSSMCETLNVNAKNEAPVKSKLETISTKNAIEAESFKNLVDEKLTENKNQITDNKNDVKDVVNDEIKKCTLPNDNFKSAFLQATNEPTPSILTEQKDEKNLTAITETAKENPIIPNNSEKEKNIVKSNGNNFETPLPDKIEVSNSEKQKQIAMSLLNQAPILNQTPVPNQTSEKSEIRSGISKLELQNKSSLPTKESNKSNITFAKHSTLPAQVQHITETKIDTKQVIPKVLSKTDQNPINNNHAAVPFGKWTEANRQEFLNKIKESKIPTNISNAKQIKQPNDLNRRDVLQKIDSQRQTNNAIALAKIQENKNSQTNVKVEAKTFAIKSVPISQESKLPVKTEQVTIKASSLSINKNQNQQEVVPKHPVLMDMPNTVFSSSAVTKKEPASRKEINNQDLIDKTIEGIINKAILVKPEDRKDLTEAQTNIQHETATYTGLNQSKDSKPSTLDAIEMKMNELHGIPFVERPSHELPHRFNSDIKIKTYGNPKNVANKASKLPNELPNKNKEKSTKDLVLELDSEEEIIEFVPVTGDMNTNKINTEANVKTFTTVPTSQAATQGPSSKKDTIITENEFDKFARGNSITYENCLTVNFDSSQPRNIIQSVVEKGIPVKKYSRNELLLAEAKTKSTNKHQQILRQSQHSSKIQITSKLVSVSDDALNKNYHSKLQIAYQSALTAKRQKESPITIIEDKPVKVVFMDSNHEYIPKKLNVQGNQLSPTKKNLPELPERRVSRDADSLDSDILDITEEAKTQDDAKCKTKHQRKQVLTPVETPELELIEPEDLTSHDEGFPKKKRKLEDSKGEKSSKHLLPKKTYLLNRSTVTEENLSIQPSTSQSPPKRNTSPQANISKNQSDAASAIDNLVKAAELLENQSEALDVSKPSTSSDTPQATPVKRSRGRPRKYPLPDGVTGDKVKTPSPQKKPRLSDKKRTPSKDSSDSDSNDDDSSAEEGIARENWTMGKINENIVCPICNKLFRSENVVFKHVKHCSGPSPNRLNSGKRGRRRSRRSGEMRKSRGSKSDDTNDTEKSKSQKGGTPKKSKSNDSTNTPSTSTENNKDEVIVIDDSPASVKPAQQAPRRPGRPRIYPKNAIFECEFCGKQFRQMSYLVNHKLQHKKNEAKKDNSKTAENDSVFSCEVCKKEFRKLHHLVQHRLIHNSNEGSSKPTRKSSSEQSSTDKGKDQEVTKQDEQNAAFRCEPCDKSFRKLHHLVEHRETHDGINKQKIPSSPASDVKPTNSEPPQCEVCNKTFRKLHHLVEHKEQHNDANSDKSDDKSVKSSLSTKDIIHECSLCYMVFPNEHSLNKHTIICLKKKKQAAEKQNKAAEEVVTDSLKEQTNLGSENIKVDKPLSESILIEEETSISKDKIQKDKDTDLPAPESKMKMSDIIQKRLLSATEAKPVECKKPVEPAAVEIKAAPAKRESISTEIVAPQIPDKIPKIEEKTKDKQSRDEQPKTDVLPKEKFEVLPKEKYVPNEHKRRQSSNGMLSVVEEAPPSIESSDDEEVRYMFNPEYKAEKDSERMFMEVRAKKRNSLQVERPRSKDFVKRRTSLQHPPKVPRLKPRPIEVRVPSTANKPKLESVSSMDSDDSDVKYSFPKNDNESAKSETIEVKPLETTKSQKDKKKSLNDKQKTLTGIAKRKSLAKATTQIKNKPSPIRQVKRRIAEVEHRCDCGELFSSAALLSRHTSLAHTPPRIRRNRSPLPQAKPKLRKSTAKTMDSRKNSTNNKQKITDSRKSSTNDKPKPANDSRKSSVNDKPRVVDSRKSSTNDTIKPSHSRKSSVNDKPKPVPRQSSGNEKAKIADTRKSSTNEKPKTDSRKSNINNKVAEKSDPNSKDKTPKRKSVRVEISTSLKRTNTKARRDVAHRGVPVPEKLKKFIEKNKNK